MTAATHKADRWRFFMTQARESLHLAQAAPTAALKRKWLAQAVSEIERADGALFPDGRPGLIRA